MKAPLAALLALALAPTASADLAVIANRKNELAPLATEEVQDVFLGRTRTFPNHRFALPFDQSSPLRGEFYQKLTGRLLPQIDAYWARIVFSGQGSPPPKLPDDAAVLQMVRENEDAIGYIDKINVDNTIRVLLILP